MKKPGTFVIVFMLFFKTGLKKANVWAAVINFGYKLYKFIKPFFMSSGIITNTEGKAFGKYLDSFIDLSEVKFMGISAERYDDKAISGVINYVDNKWGDLIPGYCIPALRSIIVDVPEGNYDKLAANIALVGEGLAVIKNQKIKSFIEIQVRKLLEGIMEFLEANYVSEG